MNRAIPSVIFGWMITSIGACGGNAPPNGEPDPNSTPDGSTEDGSTNPSDGSVDGGVLDGRVIVGTAPTLLRASPKVVGRRGFDLRVELEGDDPDRDVTSIRLRAFDGEGAPIAFGIDDEAPQDSQYERTAVFMPAVNEDRFADALLLAGFFEEISRAKTIEIAVVDREGSPSAFLRSAIGEQPVRELGQACDVNFILDRCRTGLACRGEPAACVEGVAPTLSKVGYYTDPSGPSILLLGTDIDEDVSAVVIDFLDTRDQPVFVDLDSDDINESSRFRVPIPHASSGKDFFAVIEAGEGFETLVPKISVRIEDDGRRESLVRSTLATGVPTRARGQGCDPRGFDRCVTGTVCAPGIIGAANLCQDPGRLRTKACTDSPSMGAVSLDVIGRTGNLSLWDPPVGCAAGDPTRRVEGVAMLHLDQPARRVVLSTDHPETEFDTVIYVIPGCPTQPTSTLGCSDDMGKRVTTTLELTDLASGDYLVVIDAWGQNGGVFRLTAAVE